YERFTISYSLRNSQNSFKRQGDKLGQKKSNNTIKRIKKIDVDILLGLYYFRIMSTSQIRQKHSLTKEYTYKKLQILRNTGWIKTHPIHGYTNKQKRQGS